MVLGFYTLRFNQPHEFFGPLCSGQFDRRGESLLGDNNPSTGRWLGFVHSNDSPEGDTGSGTRFLIGRMERRKA